MSSVERIGRGGGGRYFAPNLIAAVHRDIRQVDNAAFLNVLARDLPDGARILTCAFHGDPRVRVPGMWNAKAYRPGLSALGNGSPVPPGDMNTYVDIASFYIDAETNRYRRIKSNFAQLHALMVDDLGTRVSWGRVKKLRLSAVIETSPDNYQGIYFINPSPGAKNREVCETLINQMIKDGLACEVDPGMGGISRVARLPVGVNGKEKYVEALGHPFQCRLVEWNPARRYTVEKIAEVYGLNLAPRPAPLVVPLSSAMQVKQNRKFYELLQAMTDAGLFLGTHGAWIDIICPWVDEHSDGCTTGSAVAMPSAQNNFVGGFRCHHGHGEALDIGDLYRKFKPEGEMS